MSNKKYKITLVILTTIIIVLSFLNYTNYQRGLDWKEEYEGTLQALYFANGVIEEDNRRLSHLDQIEEEAWYLCEKNLANITLEGLNHFVFIECPNGEIHKYVREDIVEHLLEGDKE